MARMLSFSATTYVGCCAMCARGKKHRRKPAPMSRNLGRAKEKVDVRRLVESER